MSHTVCKKCGMPSRITAGITITKLEDKLKTAKRIARERQGDIVELTGRLDEALSRTQELEGALEEISKRVGMYNFDYEHDANDINLVGIKDLWNSLIFVNNIANTALEGKE